MAFTTEELVYDFLLTDGDAISTTNFGSCVELSYGVINGAWADLSRSTFWDGCGTEKSLHDVEIRVLREAMIDIFEYFGDLYEPSDVDRLIDQHVGLLRNDDVDDDATLLASRTIERQVMCFIVSKAVSSVVSDDADGSLWCLNLQDGSYNFIDATPSMKAPVPFSIDRYRSLLGWFIGRENVDDFGSRLHLDWFKSLMEEIDHPSKFCHLERLRSSAVERSVNMVLARRMNITMSTCVHRLTDCLPHIAISPIASVLRKLAKISAMMAKEGLYLNFDPAAGVVHVRAQKNKGLHLPSSSISLNSKGKVQLTFSASPKDIRINGDIIPFKRVDGQELCFNHLIKDLIFFHVNRNYFLTSHPLIWSNRIDMTLVIETQTYVGIVYRNKFYFRFRPRFRKGEVYSKSIPHMTRDETLRLICAVEEDLVSFEEHPRVHGSFSNTPRAVSSFFK